MPPRRGIDQALVVQTAVQIADANGFEAVTLAAVAEQLGIRIPSLYNHVAGLTGLRSLMGLWAVRQLEDRLRRAAVGKAGGDALLSMADTYREFAHAHPGVYRTTLRAAAPDEPELVTAAQETIDLLFAALRPYELNTEDTLHTIRALRSVLHGFVDLEISGGFGMALDRDESFHRLIRAFIAGVEATKQEEA
jgi:AcrR family transcriptional regulator